MFQTGFPSIISSLKLHIEHQIFVRLLLLPAASLARLAAGSSNGLYGQFCAPDDGRKNNLKHVDGLTEIKKFETLHLVGYTLRVMYTLHDALCTFVIISHRNIFEWEIFQSFRGNPNTHFQLINCFPKIVSFMRMWKITEEVKRLHVTI